MSTFQYQAHCDCLDFPVSWVFYRDHCRTVHGFDPGDNEAPPQPEGIPLTLPPEFPGLDELKGNLVSLRDTLKQHVLESKGRKRRGKY